MLQRREIVLAEERRQGSCVSIILLFRAMKAQASSCKLGDFS